MSTKKICDRCTKEIEKVPTVGMANDRSFEICNDCWKEFLIYMGKPFYKVESLLDRTKH